MSLPAMASVAGSTFIANGARPGAQRLDRRHVDRERRQRERRVQDRALSEQRGRRFVGLVGLVAWLVVLPQVLPIDWSA